MLGRPSIDTTRSAIRPTARMATWGGIMIAVNASTPNIPRLLIVKVPPAISPGRNLPLRARSVRSRRSAAISAKLDIVGVVDHWRHYSAVDRHRQAYVDFGIFTWTPLPVQLAFMRGILYEDASNQRRQ